MKKATLLLGLVMMFFSCQKENEEQVDSMESEQTNEEAALAPLGETDLVLQQNGDEELTARSEEFKAKISSNTYGYYYSGYGYGYGNNNNNDDDNTECVADIAGFEAGLPDTVSITTTAKPGEESYFLLDLHDSDLAGTDIPAWCIDVDLGLDIEGPLDFEVYSSYEELPAGKFEKPENFDLVNWILNQDFVGQDSASGGVYTYGHVQWAIWELVDDRNCRSCTYLTNPTGDWNDNADINTAKGQEIVELALANGEDFVPGCGELIGVVLIPEGKQSLIIAKEVPSLEPECNDCEGKVSSLDLEFDWKYSKRVRIYQKKNNSYYGVKIYDQVVKPGGIINLEGVNNDGTFGNFIYIYIGNRCYYYTCIKTNCYLNLGPGYSRGVFNVVGGTSTQGGELCEYEAPKYHY